MFFAKQNEYREYQLENPNEFLKQKIRRFLSSNQSG